MAFSWPGLVINEFEITLANKVSQLKSIRDMVHLENGMTASRTVAHYVPKHLNSVQAHLCQVYETVFISEKGFSNIP